MKKLAYYCRVFFFSYEILFILFGASIFFFWKEEMLVHFDTILVNKEFINWVVLLPVAIVGWMLKEGFRILFPDEKSTKALHHWPDFWKLKAHVKVGIFSCVLFLLPCLFMWLTNKLRSFEWIWFFFVFFIALIINAYTFYSAKIELKSILVHLQEK